MQISNQSYTMLDKDDDDGEVIENGGAAHRGTCMYPSLRPSRSRATPEQHCQVPRKPSSSQPSSSPRARGCFGGPQSPRQILSLNRKLIDSANTEKNVQVFSVDLSGMVSQVALRCRGRARPDGPSERHRTFQRPIKSDS